MSLNTVKAGLGPLRNRLTQAMARLNARERRLVQIAALVVGLGLVWWLGLAPALQTLRQAPERHAQLSRQLADMQRMAATAGALREQGNARVPPRNEALRALEQATASLGPQGQLAVLGDRATLTLRSADPTALAQWLAQARLNARVSPVESQLAREGAGWSGSVVLSGPGLAGE